MLGKDGKQGTTAEFKEKSNNNMFASMQQASSRKQAASSKHAQQAASKQQASSKQAMFCTFYLKTNGRTVILAGRLLLQNNYHSKNRNISTQNNTDNTNKSGQALITSNSLLNLARPRATARGLKTS